MDLIARKGKLFVAVLWLFLVTAAQVGGEESARIALVSQKSFDDTVQHLDWQLGGYGITILSRVDFGSLAETVGVSKKGSLILEVMRRSWLKDRLRAGACRGARTAASYLRARAREW